MLETTLFSIFFWIFSVFLVTAALGVAILRNPVYGALSLIFALFNGAGLFLLLGAEFLAMILVLVYVGAVAVLFLFVVMMLDVDVSESRNAMQRYAPVASLVATLLLAEVLALFWNSENIAAGSVHGQSFTANNTLEIGKVLFVDYILYFEVAGLRLLVAMIGAIALVHRNSGREKRQNQSEQSLRSRGKSVRVVKVESGKGVAT